MTVFYAKSTGGFYATEIHGDSIPADAVVISAEQHAALLEGQSAGKIIVSDAEGNPVLVEPPKATPEQVWERIKADRDRRKAGGVKVGTKWFHSDEASKIQQIGLVMMGASIPAGLIWKTMDGSFVTMNPALAGQVFTAVVVHEQAVFAAAETHNTAMRAAADPAAYDFSSGWPASYVAVTP